MRRIVWLWRTPRTTALVLQAMASTAQEMRISVAQKNTLWTAHCASVLLVLHWVTALTSA